MAHGDAREGKWRGNWRMEWISSTLHTTAEYVVSSITTADAHTSAASSRLNWRPCRFKWTRPFRRKTKCGFCACANAFQTQSTTEFTTQQFYNLPTEGVRFVWTSEQTTIIPIFKGQTAWPLMMWPTGCPKRRKPTTNLRYVKSQKTEDLIYTVADAWNSLYNTKWLVFTTETEFVYCAVHSTFHVLPTQCIYVFCVDLSINSDYFLYRINWLVSYLPRA
jgi:hypothetical protein